MEPQAAKTSPTNSEYLQITPISNSNSLQLRDFIQRPPGNVVRDSAPNIYFEEFVDLQRPAYKPDGRGTEYTSWLTLGTENLYKSIHQREVKTPEQTSESYFDDATKSLKKSHLDGEMKFTTDGTAPKIVEFQNDYKVGSATNANDIAAARLGANASREQLEKYAATIVAINKLDAPEKEIAPGTTLKLPGQTADGGIIHRSKGKTYSVWQDGSNVEVAERGQGKATFTDRTAGCEVIISWDPEEKKNCTISKTYEERRIETDGNGVRSERIPPNWGLKSKVYEDDQGRKVSMEFDPKDDKLKQVSVQDWKTGASIELEPADDKGLLKGKKIDKYGDVLATMNGRVGPDDKLNMYEVKKVRDLVTRTYENGTVEEYKADKLTKRVGKDDWGRQIEEVLKPPGRMPPHQVHVTLNDNQDVSKRTKLTFTRTDFGEYWGETVKDGKVEQRHQLRASGQIMTHRGQRVSSELKDGTKIERSQIYDARDPKKVSGYQISQSKDGATYTVQTDRDGNIQNDKYAWGGLDGREIVRTRATNGRLFTGITMTEANGHKTNLAFDVTSGMFMGQRFDATGKAVENVVVADDKILYNATEGRGRRLEVFDLKASTMLGKKPKGGAYDIQKGTESFENEDESLSVKPVSAGRTDKVIDDYCNGRTIIGTTVRGERSLVTPEKTVIHNPGGTGARLNSDLTIDRWGEKETDNAFKEPLTSAEADYLKHLQVGGQENDVDLRDFLEIHRQFITRPDGEAALNKFYTAMKTLDSSKNLTPDEQKALRINIMHDVAHPEEMDQSRSPTCNTEVVRREMAMNVPHEYAMRFFHAMNDGSVPIYKKAVDGEYGTNTDKPDATVPVDPENLKLADCTGRNLAARIFDNMAIQVSAHPEHKWVATEDGIGKFLPTDPEMEPKEFSGMQLGDIADVLTKLTGVNRGVLQLSEIEDLKTAFEANGNKSMIVAVNASKTPFTWDRIDFDFDELFTNHVVTLSNVYDENGSTYVNFMNQWGLESDHSTPAKSVGIERFLNNMTGLNTSWRGVRPMTPPQVITSGDPTKVHKIVGGKIIEDPKYILKNGRVQER